MPSSLPSRTVSYIIKPNTSTKVVTKLCRQPFKVSCLISYRSLSAAHTQGCKSASPRPSFFRRLSSKCRSSEGNKGRSSFVRGRGVGWEEGGWFCLSVSLPLCFVAGKPRPFHGGSKSHGHKLCISPTGTPAYICFCVYGRYCVWFFYILV